MNLLLEESGAADSSSRYRLDTPWKGVRTAEKTITEKYHFPISLGGSGKM